MNYELTDRVALVTGAARGIGRAIATTLAREGAKLALVSRDLAALEETARAIERDGGEARAVEQDLSDLDGAATLAARASEALGAPPSIVVINHATFTPMAKLYTLEPEAIRGALAVDIEGTFALLRGALPEMMGARFGRIVLVGSVAARIGQGKAPLYTAIKSALEGLAYNLAIDYSRFGITANLVAPGVVQTERLERRSDEETRQRMREGTSVGELATPEQIAEVAAFLCSTAASYVTGAVIPVTGGAHLANLW